MFEMTASVERTALSLPPDLVERFWQDGFVAIPRISSPAEIGRVRRIYDKLFSEKAGREAGRHFDMVSPDENDAQPARLPQILHPSASAPELLQTEFRCNALAIATQLLGEGTEFWFEHAICKPAFYGAATPWHQDEAHRTDMGLAYEQVSFWMPLQEATLENGCMQYIAGSHRGPLIAHHSPNNDPRLPALDCSDGVDSSAAVPCPLEAGGAVVHHWRTLHHAGPNQTDTARFAYILAFRGPTRPDPSFRGHQWNIEKQTAAQGRAKAWRRRTFFARACKNAAKRLRSRLGTLIRRYRDSR